MFFIKKYLKLIYTKKYGKNNIMQYKNIYENNEEIEMPPCLIFLVLITMRLGFLFKIGINI